MLFRSFDDSCVVAIAFEELVWTVENDEGASEELECDCFGPADVTALGVPVSDEGPSAPMFSHNDSNAHS